MLIYVSYVLSSFLCQVLVILFIQNSFIHKIHAQALGNVVCSAWIIYASARPQNSCPLIWQREFAQELR